MRAFAQIAWTFNSKPFRRSFQSNNCQYLASTALHPIRNQLVLNFGHLAPFGSYSLQVLRTPSLTFRSQAMHPLPLAQGLHQKAAIGAVEMMEETMRVLTIIELMRLSKIELCDLAARITNAFPDLPEGSPERAAAVINLRNIRTMLARRNFSP
jgi:hypothetical protein